MASNSDNQKEQSSAEYQVFRKELSSLVDVCQFFVTVLATGLYSEGLINDELHEKLSDKQQARLTTTQILSYVMIKIKNDSSCFAKFASVLAKSDSDVSESLKEKLQRFHSAPDGDVLSRSKSSGTTNSDQDSAYDGGELSEAAEGEDADTRSESVSRQPSSRSSLSQSGSMVLKGEGGVTWEVPYADDTEIGQKSLEANKRHNPSQMVPPSPALSRNMMDLGSDKHPEHIRYQMEIKNLNLAKSYLEKEIIKLKQWHINNENSLIAERDEVQAKLELQNKVLKDKDSVIKKLKADQDFKDETVKRLRREKAELEIRINKLKKERDDARRSKELAERRLSAVTKEFEEREATLINELEAVSEREGKAVLQLHIIQKKLVEAELEKEKDRTNWIEKTLELEKIQVKLESDLKIQQLTHSNELALKETQLANTEKELMKLELEAARKKLEEAGLG